MISLMQVHFTRKKKKKFHECGGGGPKQMWLQKGEPVTLFPLMEFYKIMKQNIPSISEAFQLLISKKMVEKVCNESNKKARDVFSSSNEKQEENWKDVTPKEV
jgi:hypothetical protein